MAEYRAGTHHGVTIVRKGDGYRCDRDDHDCARGHMVAVVTNGDQALAERICTLLNGVTVTPAAEHAFHSAAAAARTMPRHEGYATHDGLCAALRALGFEVPPTIPVDSCTCPLPQAADPACPVHEGRKARGPRPPYLGPGCICDGSGRTCPRHGVVL